MVASPVVLILGAGSNIGASVARAFALKGYKVAVTSRQPPQDHDNDDYLRVQGDLSDPNSVQHTFATVRSVLGHPSVVVYNAAKSTVSPPKDPLALPVTDMLVDLAVNTASVLTAAHEAINGFAQLPSSASKTFIYTGNRLNIAPIDPLMSLGIGKSATAHIIVSAAQAYQDKGYKFYYADERKADGSPAFSVSGEAHGRYYTELAESQSQGPWLATFVKDEGYVDFGLSP